MFCPDCGRRLPDNLRFCDACGASLAHDGATTVNPITQQLPSLIRERSSDAWRGFKLIIRSPLDGLHASFVAFGERRAIEVAILFAVAFEVVLLLAGLILKSKAEAMLGGIVGAFTGELTVKQLLKLLVLGVIPFASLVGACALTRLVFRGTGRISGDIYTAGAVLLPIAGFVLLFSLLGVANFEVIVVLFVFALTYVILILHAGCMRLACIPEAGVAPAVPVIALLTAWMTKIVITALW